MASSSTPGTAGQLVKPEYRNWLALGHALTTVLCHGLRPFITREMEAFYRNLTARIAGPCTCVYVSKRRPNEFHDMTTCPWANILEVYHHKNKPNWRQSDPAKWMDPVLGPWEIAKLFLPDLGGHADIKSADDMDVTGILNLVNWCKHFTIPQALIKDVRSTRNRWWGHVPRLELTDADKNVAFDFTENLLKAPQLGSDPDAQKALAEIVNLRSISNLHSFEAHVLGELIEVLKFKTTHMAELEQMKKLVFLLEKRLEDLEQKEVCLSLFHLTRNALKIVHSNLVINLKGIRKTILVMWLVMAFSCSFFVVELDDDSFIRGNKLFKKVSISNFISVARASLRLA